MQGFQVTFFTQQDRRHGSLPLGEWLLQETRRLGVAGATLVAATEGLATTENSIRRISSNWLTSRLKW